MRQLAVILVLVAIQANYLAQQVAARLSYGGQSYEDRLGSFPDIRASRSPYERAYDGDSRASYDDWKYEADLNRLRGAPHAARMPDPSLGVVPPRYDVDNIYDDEGDSRSALGDWVGSWAGKGVGKFLDGATAAAQGVVGALVPGSNILMNGLATAVNSAVELAGGANSSTPAAKYTSPQEMQYMQQKQQTRDQVVQGATGASMPYVQINYQGKPQPSTVSEGGSVGMVATRSNDKCERRMLKYEAKIRILKRKLRRLSKKGGAKEKDPLAESSRQAENATRKTRQEIMKDQDKDQVN